MLETKRKYLFIRSVWFLGKLVMARPTKHPNAAQYKPLIDFIKADLGMTHLRIAVRFRDLSDASGIAVQTYSGYDGAIFINRRCGEMGLTIAHELRHIWQQQQGHLLLKWRGNAWYYYWRGRRKCSLDEEGKLFRNDPTGYDDLPWERDANRYERRIYSKIKKEHGFLMPYFE